MHALQSNTVTLLCFTGLLAGPIVYLAVNPTPEPSR